MLSFCAAPASSSELFKVETQSLGSFLLHDEWRVVSKDEASEQCLISPDLTLNVRQALYAKAEYTSGEHKKNSALQIFSIWGTDSEGNETPLPDGMFNTYEKFVTGLIGERYGNVSELGKETIETALEDISVATYGVTFSLEEGPELRYKCAALYRGGKRVWVLLNYSAGFEDYRHEQLAALLNTWVGSLTFTPVPAPVTIPVLESSLPTLPIAKKPIETAQPAVRQLQPQPPEERPVEQPRSVNATRERRKKPFSFARFPIAELALLWGTFFLVMYLLHRRNVKKRLQAENTRPESEFEETVPEPAARRQSSPRPLPTLEEWLEEKPLFERGSYVSPASSEGGFDRVYSLFDQVLRTVGDTEPAVEEPEDRQ